MRSLERKIGALCRAVAVKVAEGHKATEPEHEGLDGSAQEARGQSPVQVSSSHPYQGQDRLPDIGDKECRK